MGATFVALPFLLSARLELPLTAHWKMYIGAVILSLAIAVPLIVRDHRQGRDRFMGLAVGLILVAEILLTFTGSSIFLAFVAMVLYFGGFNFLEAGLPARLSVLADDDVRGASLGVFSTSQFLGVFVGGLIGGRFIGQAIPATCSSFARCWRRSGWPCKGLVPRNRPQLAQIKLAISP